MTWVRISDDWFEDDRIEQLGGDVVAVHLSALAYVSRRLSDGQLPRRATRHLYPVADLDGAISTLLEAGLWQGTEAGYLIVPWADHVLPADEVQKMREQNRIRQERFRRHQNNDHSLCERCWYIQARRGGRGNAVTDGVSNTPPTRPDPTRSDSGGTGRAAGAAASATAPAARRPQRTEDGWLVEIDSSVLTSLPFDGGGAACPHRESGWTWTKDDTLACERCDQAARHDPGNNFHAPQWHAARHLAMGRPGSRPYLNAAPDEVWKGLHAADPKGVTIALDLASVIFQRFGPITEEPDNVNALADDIYRRNINSAAHADAWAAYEHEQQQTDDAEENY
ncbi:hypothetical protein ACFP3Q_11425 [Nocardioides sp. GCM10027113]|uniref:hypothetical protein n=1 Tax=unclassified Nocardioides TaxID=2615069 RepID=UPI0036095B72